jgi:hypothetical protein
MNKCLIEVLFNNKEFYFDFLKRDEISNLI